MKVHSNLEQDVLIIIENWQLILSLIIMNNEDEEEANQSAETSISTFKAHPQIVKAFTVDSVSGWSNSLRFIE